MEPAHLNHAWQMTAYPLSERDFANISSDYSKYVIAVCIYVFIHYNLLKLL